MGERREVARGADRAFRGDAGIDAAVVELEQALDEQRPHARMAARERENLEREDEAHGRVVEQRPGAGGVRKHDVRLQAAKLVVRDARLRKTPETGVDAVRRFSDATIRSTDSKPARSAGRHAGSSSSGPSSRSCAGRRDRRVGRRSSSPHRQLEPFSAAQAIASA